MLDIDGLFVSVTCNNNFSGHGMYQFSPEFFLSSLNKKYGMEIEAIYIGKVHTKFEEWIDVLMIIKVDVIVQNLTLMTPFTY